MGSGGTGGTGGRGWGGGQSSRLLLKMEAGCLLGGPAHDIVVLFIVYCT